MTTKLFDHHPSLQTLSISSHKPFFKYLTKVFREQFMMYAAELISDGMTNIYYIPSFMTVSSGIQEICEAVVFVLLMAGV
jgi:hypothetical protein